MTLSNDTWAVSVRVERMMAIRATTWYPGSLCGVCVDPWESENSFSEAYMPTATASGFPLLDSMPLSVPVPWQLDLPRAGHTPAASAGPSLSAVRIRCSFSNQANQVADTVSLTSNSVYQLGRYAAPR